jgi:hypothetical protein
MKKYIASNIHNLRSWASISTNLGELATKTASRLESFSALNQKAIVDTQIASEITKLGSAVMDAIKASKNSDILKGLLFGTGAAIPLAAAGAYVTDKAGDRAEDLGTKALVATPAAILAGLAAGRAMNSSRESKQASYSIKEAMAVISLNQKLNDSVSNIKVAEDRKYTESVILRSNAHLADIVNSILN